LEVSEPRPSLDGSRGEKKNYAERLSRAIAQDVAQGLRNAFPGITPLADGTRHETPARTAKGFKKLDVGYSTPELGLGLGVSIKTLNYRDRKTKRYTKNYSRVDNELRAEATDYHVRQPYSVLAGLLYLPADSCDDGDPDRPTSVSSFASAVRYFRSRRGREQPTDDPELFEAFYIGIYEFEGSRRGQVWYFDAGASPPRARRPTEDETWSHSEVLALITSTYDERNDPPFEFVE